MRSRRHETANWWAQTRSRRRRALAAFLPTDLDGLVLWLRADRGITIATGVSQWDDLSGSGNHVTQATGASQPAYLTTGGANNRPFLRFDGVNDVLTNSNNLGAQPNHCFAAGVISRGNIANNTLIDTPTGNQRRLFGAAATTFDIFAGSAIISRSGADIDTMGAYEGLFSGASSKLRTHNTAYATGNPGAGANGGVMVGSGPGDPSDADIYEVIIYNRTLSDSEAERVMVYQRQRYAL